VCGLIECKGGRSGTEHGNGRRGRPSTTNGAGVVALWGSAAGLTATSPK
jgi:hypothetical protein